MYEQYRSGGPYLLGDISPISRSAEALNMFRGYILFTKRNAQTSQPAQPLGTYLPARYCQ